MSKKFYLALIAYKDADNNLQLVNKNKLTIVMNDQDELSVGMPVTLGSNKTCKALIIRHLKDFDEKLWKGDKNWGSPWKKIVNNLNKKIEHKFKKYKVAIEDDWIFDIDSD